MSATGKALAQRRRTRRLSAAAAAQAPAVVTLADIKAEEASLSDALSRLTLSSLAPLRSIAQSESRRYASLSLSADDVMSEALRRVWRTAPAVIAAIGTGAEGEARAHFRMTARSVVSNERERLSVSVSASEAERESAIAAAMAADGSFLKADRDEARELSLRLSSALALTGHGGTAEEARKAEGEAFRREAKAFRPFRENETDYAFLIIRETSLERLMTEELRYSSALSLSTESAGREGTAGASLSALTEPMERFRFREALSLSAASLEARALSAPKAERPVWEALAATLRLSEGERVERYFRQRERTRAAEDEAAEAAGPLAALKAQGKAADKDAVKAAGRLALAAERKAERERDALRLALRLSLAGETLSSLLIILDASVSATGDITQSLEAQRKEHSTFDFRSLAEYATQAAADDASVKRYRIALRSLITEAETLAGYQGVTRETLARWRSESGRREIERLIRRSQAAAAQAQAQRERSEAEAERLASLPRYFKYEGSRIVPLSEAEAEERDLMRAERELPARLALAAQRRRKADERTALVSDIRQRLSEAGERRRLAFLRFLNAGAGAPASLSAEGFASLTEAEREAEAGRWRRLASYGFAEAAEVSEALASRRFLTAEAAALALRSREREALKAAAAAPAASVSGTRGFLPFPSLAAPPLPSGPPPLKGAAPLSTLAEREALEEVQPLILGEDAAARAEARSVIWRSRQRDARDRYRKAESAARRERREAAERHALRKAEREAQALALAETLSEASGAAFRVMSEADTAAARERAAERAEARRDALKAGRKAEPRRTLKNVLASLSEDEAEETEARREALRVRQSEAAAPFRESEAAAQRMTLAADAHALSLALAEDARRREGKRFSPSLPLARRSEAEAEADTLALRSWRRLAGSEASEGKAALAYRRMTAAERVKAREAAEGC